MDNVQEFFEMGGHAAFIWPSYVIVFLVLIVLGVTSYRQRYNAERDLAALEASKRADKG